MSVCSGSVASSSSSKATSIASSRASSIASSKASLKSEASRRAASSRSSSRSETSRRSHSSKASTSTISSVDLLTQALKTFLHLNDGGKSTKHRKMFDLPRYCFGSTAIFVIVFCLLCSLSALGPKILESMMQDQIIAEKEYPDIDTSTCVIQPTRAPNSEVQSNFLTSYPGSGARLLSRLVEALTGIPTTDDVYSNGVTNTVGINTYYPCPEGQETPGADSIPRAAILIRNPLDAIPGYHNLLYQQMNNLPVAPEEDWAMWSSNKLLLQIEVWTKHLEYWLDRYPAKNRLVASYDQLLSPKRGPIITKELAEFLNLSNGVATVPDKDIPCLWQRLVDEYELTLPPSERRPRVKRVLPRKTESGSVRAKSLANFEQDKEQDDKDGNDEGRSNQRRGDDRKSNRGSNQDEDEQDDERNGVEKGRQKSNRLGGKEKSRANNDEEEQKDGNDKGDQDEEGEGKPASDSEEQSGEQEEQSEEKSDAGGDAGQRGGNPQSQSNADQQKADNGDQSNEGAAEAEGEESGKEEQDQGAESDQQVDRGNDEQSEETATERRGNVQKRGRPNHNVANSKGEPDQAAEGEQNSDEGTEASDGQRRRRRLSSDGMVDVVQRRQLREIKKQFPLDGRKELLIQLSRLLEKYHRDENLAGILVEYIDDLEKRYPS